MINQDQIKQILFSEIESISRNTIQTAIASDIKASQKYIDILIEKVQFRLDREMTNDLNNMIMVVLYESILHFMLTVSTIPSEIKLKINDNLTADIVIPNLHKLKMNPSKSLVIQIIKDKKRLERN